MINGAEISSETHPRQGWVSWLKRRRNLLLFLGGFLFDALTIKRIDSWPDLVLQFAYLAGLTFLLVRQYHEHLGVWAPGKILSRVWPYNVEVLHFLYGGLLSAYVVLYSKSGSGFRSVAFFALLLGLMVLNEMPQVRRVGYRLRLGLYAFCVVSFLLYFIPVLIGQISTLIFILTLVCAAYAVWKAADLLTTKEADRAGARRRLFLPAGGVLAAIAIFYALGLIPPVPLSVKYSGVYHVVEKMGHGYDLRFPRPAWYAFWKDESSPFLARPGDSLYYFASVFAPRRFHHRVNIRWEKHDDPGGWRTTDVIPMTVVGGRDEGFRGFALKSNYQPGRWRVSAETQDGRTIGRRSFTVVADESQGDRLWSQITL